MFSYNEKELDFFGGGGDTMRWNHSSLGKRSFEILKRSKKKRTIEEAYMLFT